jgi:hypothetical protein
VNEKVNNLFIYLIPGLFIDIIPKYALYNEVNESLSFMHYTFVYFKKDLSMSPEEQEIHKTQDKIAKKLRAVFTDFMIEFDESIPENNDRQSAELIYGVMQKTMTELNQEIQDGKYDYYKTKKI